MSGKQFRVSRKVATVPVVAGGFATVDLPRTYDYESIFVRLVGGIQLTVAAGAVRAEAPCQSIPRIEVIADGKNTLFSAPLWFAALGNVARPITQSGARATTPPSGVGIATYQVEANGIIDFMTVDGVRSKDSNFRSSGLSLFQCRLSFGAAIDNFVPGAGVGNFSNLNVEIWTQEVVEMPDANGAYTSPSMLRKVSYQEIALAASNVNQQIKLPSGNLIRSVFMRGEGNVTAGEPATTTYNNVQLASGVDVRFNLTGGQLRAKNNSDYGQVTAGYLIADFCAKGGGPVNLTDLWDVTGNAQPELVADVLGGANVKTQVVTTEYIPIVS